MRAILGALVVLLAAPGGAGARVESAPAGPVRSGLACSPVVDAGGSCTILAGDELTVSIDVGSPEIGGSYRFVGPFNLAPPLLVPERDYAAGTFCGSVADLWVPIGAERLEVTGDPAAGCGSPRLPASISVTIDRVVGAMALESSFANGARIDPQHTCAGANLSPPLAWTNLPEATQQLALIMEDPDTPIGTVVHWIAYAIDPAGQFGVGTVPGGTRQGSRNFGSGYSGPCPPNEHGEHRYIFHLYALAAPLDLPEGATGAQLRAAMTGLVLDRAELVGLFSQSNLARTQDS